MNYLAAGSNGGSAALGFVLIGLGIVLYWVPSIVGWARHVPHLGSVLVINGFLGWTLVGWVVALAMACRSAPQQIAVVQQVSIPQPPADPEPGTGIPSR